MTVRTQTRTPGTVVSDDANGGTVAWSAPEEAAAQDGVYAEAENTGSEEAVSESLWADDFGFTLPTSALLQGYGVRIRRRSAGGVAPEFGSVTSGSGSSSAGANRPANTAVGDTLIAFVLGRYDGDADPAEFSAQAGWTLVARANASAGTYAGTAEVWQKTAGDAEPASYVFTSTAPSLATDTLVAIARYAGGQVVGSPTWTVDSSAEDDQVVAASVTTTRANTRVVGLFGTLWTERDWTPPSGMTERGSWFRNSDEPGDLNSMLCDYVQATAGATGAKTAVVNTNTLLQFGILVQIEGAGGAVDDVVSLILPDGSVGSTNKALAGGWPTEAGDTLYGDADDLWDESLDAADINDEDSGVLISATLLEDVVAGIDVIEATATYEVSLDITPTTTTLEAPNDTLEATFEVDGETATMNSTRWRIYADAAGTQLIYDSGVVVSSATSHVIGSGTPAVPWAAPLGDTTYYLRVTGTEDGTADPDGVGDPISGDSGLVSITTDWTLPTAPTGLAAVAVTEEV